MGEMMNILKPDVTLLVKLGSIAVHADEMISAKGHPFDMSALESLLHDPEVVDWLKAMDKNALLPVRR